MKNGAFIHFIGALILLALVGTLNFFWYGMVNAETAQASTLAGEIKAKADDSTRAAEAKAELAALASDQASMQQYFVSTNDVVPFLQELQTTGSYLGSNVQIASVSATPGTPYGQLTLSLGIVGSFNSVMRTLGSIEYGPYDTAISTLSFDAPVDGSASSSPQWTANAVFTVGTETGMPVATPTASSTTATTTATTTASITP